MRLPPYLAFALTGLASSAAIYHSPEGHRGGAVLKDGRHPDGAQQLRHQTRQGPSELQTGQRKVVAESLLSQLASGSWFHLPQKMLSKKFRNAFSQSFCVVGVAELFDKTWFVAVICSLTYGIRVSFCGAFIALALHALIAAVLGAFISRFFEASLLHMMTATVFMILAVLYSWEFVCADPAQDALKERKDEAEEALGGPERSNALNLWRKFCTVFLAVFAAEWGDRTQVAMISLHSSLPIVPVCLGSVVAFSLLTASASLVASLLDGRQLSERVILGVSAVSFAVFAFLSLLDGLKASGGERVSLM